MYIYKYICIYIYIIYTHTYIHTYLHLERRLRGGSAVAPPGTHFTCFTHFTCYTIYVPGGGSAEAAPLLSE